MSDNEIIKVDFYQYYWSLNSLVRFMEKGEEYISEQLDAPIHKLRQTFLLCFPLNSEAE